MKLILSILICCSISICSAQGNATELVTEYISSEGKDNSIFQEIAAFPRPIEVANALRTSVQDSLIKDHNHSFVLIRALAKKEKDGNVRYSYIKSLEILLDNETKQLGTQVLKAMQLFYRKEFDKVLREKIHELVYANPTLRSEAALLCGFFGGAEERSVLLNEPFMRQVSKKDRYYLQLALVRLNHPETVTKFMEDLKAKRINNELIVSSLEDLAYTNHHEVYDFLFSELETNQSNCYSANNDSREAIHCGYRILETLSNRIIDFPVETDRSGDLVGDYEEALETARSWWSVSSKIYIINSLIF